ncbi:MAG: HpcH/HpaI aldolase/citrate lyase family protein [Methylovulum sp.]|uniref:HpcH/HpaI aldolase/citrate lyase family protein n=1 Tax=Methylovulum sp. TaxID=1916980 RepID=UPI00262EA905|nr:HpcH/HpaI aldolase/citrate lyase family protein [Methylovulum sp.]MDD2724404.1 HpcH/HpaI aldolase/citrate lyase family protein [Methylovulum sp.]MDD5124011.1 HpcH/HpaI aldolase/citrate lyase family protein [Methylovulum sp.]
MTMLHPSLPELFSPWMLGAPLYMPAHRRDLVAIANGEKLKFLRSMIFCTEDAVLHQDIDSSLQHLASCLPDFDATPGRYRFIRVRNPIVLARLLELPAIEKIDGFVLPKFTEKVFDAYFDQLHGTSFKVMPTLETREVFDSQEMIRLCGRLTQADVFPRILMLRIGGNDLMNVLGIRRPRLMTIYDTPMGCVISQLVTLFKPHNFALSAPVFDYLNDTVTLQREIVLDLAHGLTGKTAIHPDQIEAIEGAYEVDREDYEMALSLNEDDAPAVFKMHNSMCEVATHQQWSKAILNRHHCYGVKMPRTREQYAELSG